jgi:hypothetical protein
MKTTFFITVMVACMLYMAAMTIHFKPFRIHFDKPYLAIGWLFVLIGCMLIQYHGEKQGEKNVFNAIKKIQNTKQI